jgi:hypothetical protein
MGDMGDMGRDDRPTLCRFCRTYKTTQVFYDKELNRHILCDECLDCAASFSRLDFTGVPWVQLVKAPEVKPEAPAAFQGHTFRPGDVVRLASHSGEYFLVVGATGENAVLILMNAKGGKRWDEARNLVKVGHVAAILRHVGSVDAHQLQAQIVDRASDLRHVKPGSEREADCYAQIMEATGQLARAYWAARLGPLEESASTGERARVVQLNVAPRSREEVAASLSKKRELVDAIGASAEASHPCAATEHCGCAGLLQMRFEDHAERCLNKLADLRRDLALAHEEIAALTARLAGAAPADREGQDDELRREVCHLCGFPIRLDSDPDSDAFCQWEKGRGCSPPAKPAERAKDDDGLE